MEMYDHNKVCQELEEYMDQIGPAYLALDSDPRRHDLPDDSRQAFLEAQFLLDSGFIEEAEALAEKMCEYHRDALRFEVDIQKRIKQVAVYTDSQHNGFRIFGGQLFALPSTMLSKMRRLPLHGKSVAKGTASISILQSFVEVLNTGPIPYAKVKAVCEAFVQTFQQIESLSDELVECLKQFAYEERDRQAPSLALPIPVDNALLFSNQGPTNPAVEYGENDRG